MGIAGARHKGKIKIKGRPVEVAKAEIMVMKQKERYEDKKRRRTLFTFLDFVIITAFGVAIYFSFMKEYTTAVLFLIVGAVPLIYFIVRRILKNKNRKKKRK